MSEPVLVHEFYDSTDFLEVHGERMLELSYGGVSPAGRVSFQTASRTGETPSSGNAAAISSKNTRKGFNVTAPAVLTGL